MGLESANFLDGLDVTWPTGIDPVQQGDDHVRLLKNVLKNTFPGVDLDGFKKAVNATEDELNFLVGVTSLIQTQIDANVANIAQNVTDIAANAAAIIAGDFPSGTVMLFRQTAAPTGWTKSMSDNDKTLRVVSGSLSDGGSVAFSTLFGRTATDGHQLTIAQMPAHTHALGFSFVFPPGDDEGASGKANQADSNSSSVGGDGSHTHNIDMRVSYIDVIVATRD